MSDSTSLTFDVLTGSENYNTWRTQAENVLKESNLWDLVKVILYPAAERLDHDEEAKSKLKSHISIPLLPLVGDCTTSREIWFKLEELFDTLDNYIRRSVDDLFEDITNAPSKNVNCFINAQDLRVLYMTRILVSRFKIDGFEKFRGRGIILDTITDSIDKVIGKLSTIAIKERTNELSDELINILLSHFKINSSENGDDELTESNANGTEIRDNDIDGAVGDQENNQGNENSMGPLISPPPIQGSGKKNKCTECGKKGHNKRTCPTPMNEPAVSPETPKINAKVHGSEGPNSPSGSSMKSKNTPPRSPSKCNWCGLEGHNIRTCPQRRTTRTWPWIIMFILSIFCAIILHQWLLGGTGGSS